MGRALLGLIAGDPGFALTGALTAPDSPRCGLDAGLAAGALPAGVALEADVDRALRGAAVAIDFSLPAATAGHAAACAAAGVALVVGTTGLDAQAEAALEAAARRVPVLRAANMSLGMEVLLSLVQRAAAALADYDVEILEAHHAQKRDTPSGTALALGAAAAAGRGAEHRALAEFDRARQPGPRVKGSLGYAVLRAGDTIGEHSVWIAGTGERLVLSHTATDRATFARGALAAARYLAGRPAGRYRLAEVLGLEG